MGRGPQAGWMMGQRPGWMGRRAGWRQRFHHRPRGAHFRFVRGDARIDIQCPANQPLKDCVDAASTLIDKVAHMGAAAATAAGRSQAAGRRPAASSRYGPLDRSARRALPLSPALAERLRALWPYAKGRVSGPVAQLDRASVS